MSFIDCEPCDTCATGIAKLTCWDDKRRCSTCIGKLVKENGWNARRVLPATTVPKRRRPKTEDESQETLF